MNRDILCYQQFIDEDIDLVKELREEIVGWKKILQKRTFDDTWPSSIRKTINVLKLNIEKTLKDCEHHLKRIEEIRNDQLNHRQPSENEGNAGTAKGSAGDTVENASVA